jgi:hypothetical protein
MCLLLAVSPPPPPLNCVPSFPASAGQPFVRARRGPLVTTRRPRVAPAHRAAATRGDGCMLCAACWPPLAVTDACFALRAGRHSRPRRDLTKTGGRPRWRRPGPRRAGRRWVGPAPCARLPRSPPPSSSCAALGAPVAGCLARRSPPGLLPFAVVARRGTSRTAPVTPCRTRAGRQQAVHEGVGGRGGGLYKDLAPHKNLGHTTWD